MNFTVVTPMLGFENIKEYSLEKIDDIFMRLESTQAKEPSFTLISPFLLKEYVFDIPTSIQNSLEINDNSNLLIYNTIAIQSETEKSIVNFLAPVIFNTDNQKMAQILLDNAKEYTIEPISKFLKKEENNI